MEGVVATNFWLISAKGTTISVGVSNGTSRFKMFVDTGHANTNRANLLLNASMQQKTGSIVIRTNSPVGAGTNTNARSTAPISAQKTNLPSGSGIDPLLKHGIFFPRAF